MPTQNLGRADCIHVEGMEDGFELHISTDQGEYVVNVHGITNDLIKVGAALIDYWAEGRAAAAEHQRDLDSVIDPDAYETTDPKHPGWSVKVAAWDEREGK